MKLTKTKLSLALITASVISVPFAIADDSNLASVLTDGKLSANVNLRYESVEQNNAAKDADAWGQPLVLRGRCWRGGGGPDGP